MALLQPTRDLLGYLRRNPAVRARIAAPPNATMLYAGGFIRPMWKEIEDMRRTVPEAASKVLLPDVLGKIPTPGQPQPTLLAWTKAIDALSANDPRAWKENGFIVWRALSGIFAANAVGKVSFAIGSGVVKSQKVFAATELAVLLRNPNVHPLTRDVLAYYQRCLETGQASMNFGFITG